MAAAPGLQEAIELYERMGLEVRLEPASATHMPSACADCARARRFFRVVYTRNPRGGETGRARGG